MGPNQAEVCSLRLIWRCAFPNAVKWVVSCPPEVSLDPDITATRFAIAAAEPCVSYASSRRGQEGKHKPVLATPSSLFMSLEIPFPSPRIFPPSLYRPLPPCLLMTAFSTSA